MRRGTSPSSTALAHWLKGAGGTVGYDDFTAPARNLETLSKAGDAQGTRAALDELRGLEARLVVPEERGRAGSVKCGMVHTEANAFSAPSAQV